MRLSSSSPRSTHSGAAHDRVSSGVALCLQSTWPCTGPGYHPELDYRLIDAGAVTLRTWREIVELLATRQCLQTETLPRSSSVVARLLPRFAAESNFVAHHPGCLQRFGAPDCGLAPDRGLLHN